MADFNSTSFTLTLPSITQTITGDVWDTGVITQTLEAVASTSAAELIWPSGIITQTLEAATSASTGYVYDTGIISQSLWPVTSASTGYVYDTGVITQTLEAVTSASAGIFVIQLVDTAIASGQPFEVWYETITDVVLGYDQILAIVEEDVTHVANASDDISFDVITSIDDVVQASDSLVVIETTSIKDTVRATETITQWLIAPLIDTVGASEDITFYIDAPLLTDSAVASEDIDPGVVYNQTVTDTANASDVLYPGGEITVSDTASASDELIGTLVIEETINEVANASDELVPTAIITELLTDSALGSSSYTFDGSVYNESISDTAQAGDWIWAKDFDSIAWVLNTQSGGLTNYDNFQFGSMAFHNGVLYATSPDGLFELNADDDAGRNIDALYKTGFLDFSSESKKRISDIFIGYTGSDLECDVETFDKAVYTYEMEFRDAESPHNSRIKPGRGLASRYWRFGFRNTSGADFQIQDIAVQLAVSKRRI